ncbi:MAG: glycosyltransferase family 4 protein [Planctomycetota bacterium]|jgi:glycosyltransferase involved in cell wall biosynthesis
MKVCLFGDARSPHIVRLSTSLARVVEEVVVVTHKPARILGVKVAKFSVPPPGLRNFRRWESRRDRYLLDFLHQFDVVNMHFMHDWGLEEWMIDQGCLVVSPWGSDVVQPPGEAAPDDSLVSQRKMLLHAAAGVTVVGDTLAHAVSDYAEFEPWRVSIVPWGIDLTSFDRARFPKNRRGAAVRIGFFKGFRPVYGASTLVRAIPSVLARHPHVRFDFLGTGAELGPCQDLAESLGVAHAIEWMGSRHHWEIPGIMAGWRMTVIPSLQEAFGMAAIEASAMTLPVIASNVGGLRDSVLHHETGLLVPPSDPSALATAIIEMVESPGLCQDFGEAGRSFVEMNYDRFHCLQRQLDAYRCFLERAVGGKSTNVGYADFAMKRQRGLAGVGR